MERNSGQRNSGEFENTPFEAEIKARESEQQKEQHRIMLGKIWEQLSHGDVDDILKIDQKYTRVIEAFLEKKSVPLKEVLSAGEMFLAEESFDSDFGFVDQEGQVNWDKIPKLIFEGSETEVDVLTDDEIDLVAAFKGLVVMNQLKTLTPSQAQRLIDLQGPLFIKGLKAGPDLVDIPLDKVEKETGDPVILKERSLPKEISKYLVRRRYLTGVSNQVLTAFQSERIAYIFGGQTVPLEKVS
ncbi:MAG: hypothetical protein JWO40_792 [Candidatus Doudnabacteria bacterium]|nr:hypothetical protein [Candidatus Doudnabacteria bacterium]